MWYFWLILIFFHPKRPSSEKWSGTFYVYIFLLVYISFGVLQFNKNRPRSLKFGCFELRRLESLKKVYFSQQNGKFSSEIFHFLYIGILIKLTSFLHLSSSSSRLLHFSIAALYRSRYLKSKIQAFKTSSCNVKIFNLVAICECLLVRQEPCGARRETWALWAPRPRRKRPSCSTTGFVAWPLSCGGTFHDAPPAIPNARAAAKLISRNIIFFCFDFQFKKREKKPHSCVISFGFELVDLLFSFGQLLA